MNSRPLRLEPGADLRRSLEELALASFPNGAFVAAGLGSLEGCRLRFAGRPDESAFVGPFELLSLSGTVSSSGSHLHMSVSDSQGRVLGGHTCYGNVVRTTAEVLLVSPSGWLLARAPDPRTGYSELSVDKLTPPEHGAA